MKSKRNFSPIDRPRVRNDTSSAVISNKRMRLRDLLLFLFIFLLPTQFGKYFFLPFSYLSGIRVDYLAPALYVTDLVALILILFHKKEVLIFFKNKKVLILLSALLLPVVFSKLPMISLYKYVKILEVFAIFVIFKSAKVKYKILTLGFLIGAFMEGTLSFLQFVRMESFEGIFYFLGERPLNLSMPGIAKAYLSGIEFLRPYGTFSHPNSLGGFYLLVYTFFLFSQKLKVSPLLKNILLITSSMLVFISFSKTALLGYFAINLFFIFSHRKEVSCPPCLWAKIVVLFVLVFVFSQSTGDPESISKRLILARESFILIAWYPFSGVGLGAYVAASKNTFFTTPFFWPQPVHNIFLLFITEVGILVSIITTFFFFQVIRSNKKNVVLGACLLIVILTGMLDHYWITLQQNMLLAATIAGLTIASKEQF